MSARDTVPVVATVRGGGVVDPLDGLPVVALVGRVNVGKSTLFNVLTESRDALVVDRPGVTRDRHYGVCRRGPRPFVVVDTGGVADAPGAVDQLAARQVQFAIDEANLCVLVVDAHAGVLPADRALLERLRRTGRPLLLAVNKTDGMDVFTALAEFAALGVTPMHAVAATRGSGVARLMATVEDLLPGHTGARAVATRGMVTAVAIVGRPNVGKSTLVNRLFGGQRLVVSDVAGTTRDAIRVPLAWGDQRYVLVDTAGIRRRARVEDVLEKFSVIKALGAISDVDVAVVMLDASEGVADQDLSLIGQVLNAGKALVIAVNKWDGLTVHHRRRCQAQLERMLDFVAWATVVCISAKHGSGLRSLMRAIDQAAAATSRHFATPDLTRDLQRAVAAHQPPRVQGHTPKLRFAHAGGERPPTIVIHGTRTRYIGDSYTRYLENFFRRRYGLVGTPVRIEFRDGENPYAGGRAVPTGRRPRTRTRRRTVHPAGKR